MKIIKESKQLIEAEEMDKAVVPGEEAVAELGATPKDEIKVDAASDTAIVADMAQGAADTNKAINVEKAAEEAEKVQEVAELIRNPYGTARPGKIERTLQRSLDAALDQKDAGIRGNYQNVIIYGLAGFGKTSIVAKFCKDHNLNMFECDAKNLDPATVGGIPYPKTNADTGEITQSPISSEYWGDLETPNTVLFLDEINRANGRTRGSLLTLINEHKLPASIKDPKTGKFSSTKFFPNILFSVIAINPADDVFEDNDPLDPAMISRNAAVIKQGPDMKEFLKHLSDIYGAIAANPNLNPALKDKYAGQYAIAEKLLKDPGFTFDDEDDVRNIYLRQSKQMENYLNYRSFLMTLLRSNGKKADYLDVIMDDSGFQDTKKLMIKNILATYNDKVTTGNNVFTTAASTGKQQKAATDVAKALDDFLNTL